MGVSVFNFPVGYMGTEYVETHRQRRELTTARSGLSYARSFGAPQFAATGSMRLFQSGVQSYLAFLNWVRDTLNNGTDSFLYEANNPANALVQGEVGGVSTGVSLEVFSIKRRFLNESTLVVKVNDVVQPATEYELFGNNVEPYILTGLGFAAGTVTFDYAYRHQVIFETDPLSAEQLVRGQLLATPGFVRLPFTVVEQMAGNSVAFD